MESRHYARNAETRAERKLRLARAIELLATPELSKPSELSDAALLRGIPAVKGTEVRVSPRWKASRHTRHTMTSNKQRVERGKVNVQTNRDLALMARMGSVHAEAQAS